MQDKKTVQSGEVAVRKQAKKSDRPNVFKRMLVWLVVKFKEIRSEVKKVTWPSAKTVMTSTGIVFVIVLVFSFAVFGVDTLLSFLMKLLLGT